MVFIRKDKMRAIVLSGGGGKGAYQAGVYKAIKKLGIEYDIVTGTSIGALNGFLMVQDDLFKCLWLWKHINYNKIFEDFNNVVDEKTLKNKYFEKIINGGIDTKRIDKLVSRIYNPKRLYSSSIDYGVVAFDLAKLKPIIALKKEMDASTLKKYIIASATCFPVFKPQKYEKEVLVDGGYYDTTPINLAIDLGATEVVAVELKAVGLRKKVKNKDVKITYITPNNDLTSFLVFEKEAAKKMIKFGYNDTMKVFKKFEGKKYTFKKNNLINNYNKYSEDFVETTRYYVNQNKSILKVLAKFNDVSYVVNKQNIMKIMNKNLEELGNIFELDESLIYDINSYNKILLRRLKKVPVVKIDVKKLLNQKALIKYIYSNLHENLSQATYNLICLFPKEFLMAIYLKVI